MKKFVVWPQYLECSLPRRLGRRLSKDICVEKVSLEEIVKACEALGLKYEVEADKRYPRVWFEGKGRVLVEFNGSKLSLLKLLAQEIRKLRATGTK